VLLPEVVVMGYRQGFFPMGDPESGQVFWHRPDPRAIIPLDAVRISRSLRQTLRKDTYRTTINASFDTVILRCSERSDTWITDDILSTYSQLHYMGYAHSIETWHGSELAGGLYGVAINGAFFGESMFSHRPDASKVAFVRLVQHLSARGFTLLDTQYINEFTASLGAIEIPDSLYQQQLTVALASTTSF
jgi:leucyl/phenylalanyl-tRNA--protein transferase